MCGICGAISFGPKGALDVAALRRARDLMTARGPDGKGEWRSQDGDVWFGHRRLAIIELSDLGAQPMVSHDGRYVVTFNGEIYNYRAIRGELLAKGHVFRSTSDTEVLLELYRAKGPDFVRDLRGMFAFALWDNVERRLLLARDPYGIKPLYFSNRPGGLVFASSVKALVRSGLVAGTIEAAGLAGFLVFGSVPEPLTLHAEVGSVPAGATVEVGGDGAVRTRVYYSLAQTWRDSESTAARQRRATAGDVEAQVREALGDSVRHHLVSDVPVGAFLSAGVDSGALVGLMRDAGQNEIETITLAYDSFSGTDADEAPTARKIAELYGTKHHTRRVTAEEFEADLPKILEAMDQPSIDGVNTWFVAKAAHEIGLKVAISGVGGDELLGGYDTFRKLPLFARWLRGPSRVRGLSALMRWVVRCGRAAGAPLHPKNSELLTYGGSLTGAYLLQRGLFMPREAREAWRNPQFIEEGLERLQPQLLVANVLKEGPKTPFAQVATLEASLYMRNQLLRDTDWASMAHSLETRTPLVDHVLLERLAPILLSLDHASGKQLLGRAPAVPLPSPVINRRKTGFGIPIEAWLGAIQSKTSSGGGGEPFSRRWAKHIAETLHSDNCDIARLHGYS